MSATPTLPYQPLETCALNWIRARHLHIADNGTDRTSAALADLLDLDLRTVHRLREHGRIDLDTADRCALELGRNLSELWDDDDIEFAVVWVSIRPDYMRRRRAEAYRDSCAWRWNVPTFSVEQVAA